MILKAADWIFRVEKEATLEQTTRYSGEHCTCAYCQNYYDTVEQAYPKLKEFLSEFGINMHGPSELMPFEPTLMMACYRVRGQITQWGKTPLYADGVQIVPELADEETFLLWTGELEVPWIQEQNVEDVVSPANLPEFMERMRTVWQFRHERQWLFS